MGDEIPARFSEHRAQITSLAADHAWIRVSVESHGQHLELLLAVKDDHIAAVLCDGDPGAG